MYNLDLLFNRLHLSPEKKKAIIEYHNTIYTKYKDLDDGSVRDLIICNCLNAKDIKDLNSNSIIRFIAAQNKNNTYDTALQEIKNGHKVTHWMWYIFPQMKGLGTSERSKYYGIQGRKEAKEYINNDTLRNRLVEITEAVYNNKYTPYEIFGNDTIKFVSCMKLFASVSNIPIFKKIINKYKWN